MNTFFDLMNKHCLNECKKKQHWVVHFYPFSKTGLASYYFFLVEFGISEQGKMFTNLLVIKMEMRLKFSNVSYYLLSIDFLVGEICKNSTMLDIISLCVIGYDKIHTSNRNGKVIKYNVKMNGCKHLSYLVNPFNSEISSR